MLRYEDIMAVTLAQTKPASAHAAPGHDDVSADTDTILASTEKLLAISRGLTQPDERDSLVFRRILTPDKLFAERVKLDADKVLRTLMMRCVRARNLNPMHVNHFGSYAEGMIVGNALSSPLEEINPLHTMEQARRVTQLGPGGLPADSITPEAQALHPSTFAFLDAVSGPESQNIGVDTRVSWGSKIGDDGQIYQKLRNRHTGQDQWVSPSDLDHRTVGLPD